MRVRVAALLAALGLCVAGLSAPAWAWWTDSAGATASLATTYLRPPTGMSCTGAGLLASPTLSWTAPTTGPVPTRYVITYRAGSATAAPSTLTTTTTSWPMPGSLLALQTTYYISVQSGLLNTNWVSTTDTVGYRVSVTGVVGVSAFTACVGTYTP